MHILLYMHPPHGHGGEGSKDGEEEVYLLESAPQIIPSPSLFRYGHASSVHRHGQRFCLHSTRIDPNPDPSWEKRLHLHHLARRHLLFANLHPRRYHNRSTTDMGRSGAATITSPPGRAESPTLNLQRPRSFQPDSAFGHDVRPRRGPGDPPRRHVRRP
jgi:hypothetical protein